jgi:hypothetical protein
MYGACARRGYLNAEKSSRVADPSMLYLVEQRLLAVHAIITDRGGSAFSQRMPSGRNSRRLQGRHSEVLGRPQKAGGRRTASQTDSEGSIPITRSNNSLKSAVESVRLGVG